MKITQAKLLELIAATNGAKPIGLLTDTDARARKTGNPYGTITKRVRSVGWIGVEYEKGVNREAVRQGASPTFDAGKLPFGQWLIPGKVVEHKGKLYLRTQSTPGQRNRQRAKVLNYRGQSGKYVAYEDVVKFLPAPSESRRQSMIGLRSGSGMTDDAPHQVWVRNYMFESIKRIRIGGKTYEME